MSDASERRNQWLIRGSLVLFIAMLIFWSDIRRLISPPSESAVNPQAECYAQTVALHQYVYEAYGNDPSTGFADFDQLDTMMNDMLAWTRGLRRRDDPLAHALRPIIADAEQARDEAVAENADLYQSQAWDAVRACHAKFYSGEDAS